MLATLSYMTTRPSLDVGAIGERAAQRRTQLKLEQEDVAERAGMSRAYISRLENGGVRNPKVADLAAVAAAIDYSLDQLIYGRPSGDLLAELPTLLGRVTAPELGALMAEIAARYPDLGPDDRTYLMQSLRRL